MNDSIIQDLKPLTISYIPDELIDRTRQSELLHRVLPTESEHISKSLYLHGPRGTGKTHLLKTILSELPKQIQICYISCLQFDTQYKTLQEMYANLTGEQLQSGHHTSNLQRMIKKRLGATPTVLVLDEIDILLTNDGDDLLYYLSRLNNDNKLIIIVVSATSHDLDKLVEQRTYSSLQPQKIPFDTYTNQQIYNIIAQRASQSLKPRTLHNNAVSYIASTTQNAEIALTWLRTAAKTADEKITESHVEKIKKDAFQLYIENQLENLTQHHKYLYTAIDELSEEAGPIIKAGSIYDRYTTVTKERGNEPLSNRRISDYLKHLETLNLVEAEYHYGGKKGKTREVKPLYLQ